jgi:thioesterase domain-containing protein/acyl carrier protein
VAPARTARATASVTNVREQLADIWRDVLGVKTAIGPADCFFRLGGDSLLTVRLAFQIERRFGARLTLLSIFKASTLSQMANVISGGAVDTATPPDAASALPPMLCVGAGPIFKPFAEAIASRCHFESVPTPRDHTSISTMEELVATMVPGILATHPNGPLIVSGWSLAGVAAIEVAAQLERAGKEVPLVILFDSLSPVSKRQWHAASPPIRRWPLNLARARHYLEEALTMKPAAAIRFLVAKFRFARTRRRYDRLLREVAVGATNQFDVPLDFRKAFDIYAMKYAPPALRGRVILVRPERQTQAVSFSGDLGWAKFGYDVDLLIVPGDHKGMFMRENAGVLAERLLAVIDARLVDAQRAQSRRSV